MTWKFVELLRRIIRDREMCLSGNGSKLRRLIAGHLGTTSTTVPVVFVGLTCLATLTMFLDFACSSPMPIAPPAHTRPAPTSTYSPTPTSTLTPMPTLLPPVRLEKPEDDACIEYGAELTLCWNSIHELLANEYYRLRVWANEQEPSIFYHKEKCFTLQNPSPGEYKWTVSIVRSINADMYEPMSKESEWHHFHVLPPLLAVSGISPTSMVEGRGGQVVVSGENFTTPITLTIDVPLQIIDVAPKAITATVPATLTVNEYPVIVQDANGRVVSSTVSFTVKEAVIPPPVTLPWNCQAPVPPAPPGYDPSEACVVTPCASAPQLVGPDEGAELKVGSTVEFRWTWDCCLPPGWKFAIRLSDYSPPHSYQYIDAPESVSCQPDGTSVVRYPIKLDPSTVDRFTTIPGTYYWNIAVSRSVVEGWERLSAVSETRSFTVKRPAGNG